MKYELKYRYGNANESHGHDIKTDVNYKMIKLKK